MTANQIMIKLVQNLTTIGCNEELGKTAELQVNYWNDIVKAGQVPDNIEENLHEIELNSSIISVSSDFSSVSSQSDTYETKPEDQTQRKGESTLQSSVGENPCKLTIKNFKPSHSENISPKEKLKKLPKIPKLPNANKPTSHIKKGFLSTKRFKSKGLPNTMTTQSPKTR